MSYDWYIKQKQNYSELKKILIIILKAAYTVCLLPLYRSPRTCLFW